MKPEYVVLALLPFPDTEIVETFYFSVFKVLGFFFFLI